MSQSATATKAAETIKAAPIPQPSLSDVQLAPEPEVEQGSTFVQRAVNAVGGASPQTPPGQFGLALGHMDGGAVGQRRVLRRLQRGYGNQYVGRVIQAKLTVGQPGDVYEEEANRVADAVMRMPEPDTEPSASVFHHIQPLQIQRMCTECREEEEERIYPKEAPGQTPTVTPALEAQLNATRGSGQPLPEGTRSFMESRFGQDFSDIRVHPDSEAAPMLQAQAFTIGRDIYFDAGRYQPHTREGQSLLAHELTHTLQQRENFGHGAVGTSVQTSRQITLPWHSSEREANRIADQVVDGTSPIGAISADGVGQIQRLELPSWEDINQAGTSAIESVGEATEAVGEAVRGAVETVGEVASDVVEASTGAVDWLTTTIGQTAFDSATALARLFGGSVIIRRGCLIVTFPNIPLFPTFRKTLGETPPVGFIIPFAAGGTLIGPFPVAGMFGLLAYAQLSAEAAVGPGLLRNIRIEICPFSGRYLGTAQLYAAAAIGPRLTLFGGLFAAGGVLIPVEPPIPIIASIEGGLRGIGTGWLIGAVQNTVTLLYSGGTLSFSNVTDLMGGVLLQGDLQLFAALRLFDQIVCQYAHPLGHWQTGQAMRLTIPISASLSGTRGTGGIGPITWGPIPIEDIQTAIRPLPTGWSCLSWAKIRKILCDNKVLPPEMCEEEEGEAPGIRGRTYACAICKCSGDPECGGGRIHTIWMGATDCNRENKKKAQDLCNHDSTFLSICDLNQNRPDGKKCMVHHHDFACSDRETKEKCENRRQSLEETDRHEPSPRVPMLPSEVARRAQEHLNWENYAAALEVVVSGLRLNRRLCYFMYVNRTDRGEGLTVTGYELDPNTGNYVPKGRSRVEIYSPAFATLPWLVSTIMHEYQHVLQHQEEQTREELEDPTGEHYVAREVEAYLWEIEHAEQTGLAADVPRIQETGGRLKEHYDRLGTINPQRQAQYKLRFDAAMEFIADLATGPPPLPRGEHVYHHGTDYDTAKIVYTSDIEARGRVDFGRGFYTHTKENWQLAKQWALRRAVGGQMRGWGVVTFPIPTALWNSLVRSKLIFRDANDRPPNAPINPDTGRQMGWREFVEYNWQQDQQGNLPSWEEYNVIRGPLYGTLEETDIRQLMFTASGTPILNRPDVRGLRIAVLKIFRRRR
jgi:hypothetical protein